jgi:hypothetical protein
MNQHQPTTMTPITTIETITPEVAKIYLESNSQNQRSVRKAWVASLVKMIQAGEFQLTHQGIAFDSNGTLIDGQHRLLAIVAAQKPVQIMVTRSVNPAVWGATDQGVIRTSTEVTGLDKKLAEVSRFIAKFAFSETRPSANTLIRISNSKIGIKCNEIRQFCPSNVRYYTAAPMIAIAAIRDCMSESNFAKVQYRALAMQDFDAMTPCAKAHFRRINTANARAFSQVDAYCRAWKVFDPEKSNLSKIQVSEEDYKSVPAEIRFQMESMIEL